LIICKRYLQCLKRYGLPNHFVNIIIRLHKNAKIKVKIGSVDSEIESSIGLHQDSREGPAVFLFTMQAALETMKRPIPKPEFCTRENGVIMGERTDRKRVATKREQSCSLYADDAALFFNSKGDL
jgi:hypothetical protein